MLTTRVTIEDFEHFIEQPENPDRLFEYIGGEIVEAPSNAVASKYSQIIAGEIYIFMKGKDLGHLTAEAGGCMVAGWRKCAAGS